MPLPALPLGRNDARKLLFYAESPVKYAMFRPVHERLLRDGGGDGGRERRAAAVEVYFAGKMQGRIGSRAMAERLGVRDARPLRRGLSLLHRFDAMLTADYEIWPPFENRLFPAALAPKVQLFHGVSVRNGAVAPKMRRFQHLFVVGPYMKRAFVERGIVDEGDARLHEVGMPKTDRLLDGSLDPATVRAALRIDGARPTVMLAPTWLPKSPLDRYGEELLDALARGPWNLLLKLHDKFFDARFNVVDWNARLAALEARHERVRVVRDYDAVPAMLATDLMVSDLSSISNEFALLDRPIVYLAVEDEGDVRRRWQNLDLDTWGQRVGETVHDAKGCVAAVERGLADPRARSELRRALAADMFFHPGRAAEAAVRALRPLLGG